jgi:hypothetical protein
MRRRLLAIPLMLIASLALTTAVIAGGWASVTVVDPPADPPAGVATTIDLQVLQHDVTAVSWPLLTVVATNDSTGDIVRASATAEGAEGHYVATLTFPVEGTWSLAFESQDLVMAGSGDLDIAVAPAAPVAVATATTPAAMSIDPAVAIAGLALLVLVVGLVLGARRGRRSAPTTVSG